MSKFNHWFIEIFKPRMMEINQFIGLGVVYMILAFICNELVSFDLYSENKIVGSFFYFIFFLMFGFGLNEWARNNIVEEKILKTLEVFESDNIGKIVENTGKIDYFILNGIISRTRDKLYEWYDQYRGIVADDEKYDAKYKELGEKIKKCIWMKINMGKNNSIDK